MDAASTNRSHARSWLATWCAATHGPTTRWVHGGDLADPGSGPADIVDRIRDLGWPGVVGNADEMLFAPETLVNFAKQSTVMQGLLPIIEEMRTTAQDTVTPGPTPSISR